MFLIINIYISIYYSKFQKKLNNFLLQKKSPEIHPGFLYKLSILRYYGRAKTVNTPPRAVWLCSAEYAPTAPKPAVGSVRPAARPIPAHPPTPDKIPTYCLPL